MAFAVRSQLRNRPTTAKIGLVRAPAAHTSSPSPRPDGDASSCHCQNGRTRMSHTQTAGNYWLDQEPDRNSEESETRAPSPSGRFACAATHSAAVAIHGAGDDRSSTATRQSVPIATGWESPDSTLTEVDGHPAYPDLDAVPVEAPRPRRLDVTQDRPQADRRRGAKPAAEVLAQTPAPNHPSWRLGPRPGDCDQTWLVLDIGQQPGRYRRGPGALNHSGPVQEASADCRRAAPGALGPTGTEQDLWLSNWPTIWPNCRSKGSRPSSKRAAGVDRRGVRHCASCG